MADGEEPGVFFLDLPSVSLGGMAGRSKISHLYFSSSIFQMELKSQNAKSLAESPVRNLGPSPDEVIY